MAYNQTPKITQIKKKNTCREVNVLGDNEFISILDQIDRLSKSHLQKRISITSMC